MSIIGQENHLLSRTIRKVINIHTQRPAMKRDRYYHPPVLYGTIGSLMKRACE